MSRNVLLMLSAEHPPPPLEEVRWHATQCADGSPTAVVTTRRLTGLVPGRSVVAFYGNAALDNRFLGCGTFLEYVPLGSAHGAELLRESPLYRSRGVPAGARAFLVLRDVREAADGEGLEALGGTIEASGRPLTLDNIPKGASRVQVYFRGGSCPSRRPSGAERR